MGFFSKLLGDTPAPDPLTGKRELLRVALRDTLNRHGIPPAWIGAETLVTTARGAQKGIHCRLLIKHWEPALLSYCVPFQQSLIGRLTTLDANAGAWLAGVSWQFALPDESVCPPMPQRGWATAAAPAATAAAGAASAAAVPATAATAAKADLEQMFAVRDAQLTGGAESAKFQTTEPAALS